MRIATLAGQCRRKEGEGLNEVEVRMRIEQDGMLWQKGQGIGVEDGI
jgi:hypothetical protein